MRIRLAFAMLWTSTAAAVAQQTPAPDICKKTGEFEFRIHMYQGCIADKAKTFEITGDAADSVATAAVGACTGYQKPVAEYIDQCGGAPVGQSTMNNLAPQFHDWGVQAVIEFRAKRMGAKTEPKKSN
jgi:hypothetical protein